MRALTLALSCLTVLMVGCGSSSDQPDLGQVSGTIVHEGQPVEGAEIFFSPVEGGRTSTAITDASGNYELVYKGQSKGAAIGKHAVRITTAREAIKGDDGKVEQKAVPELASQEFAMGKKEVDVVAGPQTMDFEI